MHKRKFTVFTQLHKENNADLIEYFDDRRKHQSKIMRKTFHAIKNSDKFEKSRYNTYLQNEYGITCRTANSIISDAQGRLNALKELKVFEKKQLEQKIEHLETKVLPKLILKRDDHIAQLKSNPKGSPVRLRNIVAKKNNWVGVAGGFCHGLCSVHRARISLTITNPAFCIVFLSTILNRFLAHVHAQGY